MGRRARNKQGDPAPLIEVPANAPQRPSAKKLGKRKADTEEDGFTKRPTKKSKEVKGGKGLTRVAKSTKSAEPQERRRKTVVVEDESASSDGWENVEDDAELEASKRCAAIPLSFYHTFHLLLKTL